ncbi:MAG: ATP-binding protein, partial [Phycisphaerales bacterium]|nr:ATP-binding protein [Phycisphaerales bacterium]
MLARHLTTRLRAALEDTPVVLIHGARQVGKTTLASAIGGPERQTYSLDRTPILEAARSDPDGFVDGLPKSVFLDEVQRAPGLFQAIKHAVDRDRTPGRFLLSGSTNVMALPRLSESLAGRMEVCSLWPLSQAEIEGRAGRFVDGVFAPEFLSGAKVGGPPGDGPDVIDRVLRGGFPEAVRRHAPDRRIAWFESYMDTILFRDVRDLSNIVKINEMPRLLRLMSARTSGLLNFADMANGLGMSQTTLKRYFALLEALFLVRTIPAWSSNLSSRLTKSPKVHILDSGLAASLLGIDRDRLESDSTTRGALVESFVVMDILRLASTSDLRPRVHHFRTSNGKEVD